MNIIIVGCGKVGQTLCEQLNEEDNNVTVIDVDGEKVTRMTDRLDIMGVVGNGATLSVQKEAGIDSADLLIAVTDSDELNLLCCLIAKKAGDCHTIARIKNPDYSAEAPYLQDELGLAMVINPEYAAAQEIARVLRFPSAMKIDTFAKGKVELLKFRLPEGSTLAGMAVKDVFAKLKCDVLFCTVERDDDVFIVKGDFVFAERDIISIIATPKIANEFFNKIDYRMHSAKNVMITGGGETTHYLCDILSKTGIEVKVIEKDSAVCEDLCNMWKDVTVINGDPIDKNVLEEEGIDNTDAFLAMTSADEENIMLSLYAKTKSQCKIITKISKIEFDDVIRTLDLDTTVCPKNITAVSIVRYVRAMKNTIGSNVETLYNVIDGEVEAAEFIVKEKSPVAGKPLMELHFKENVLIASIIRDNKVIIPRGHDEIMPGDAVVIVSKTMALHDIADILK